MNSKSDPSLRILCYGLACFASVIFFACDRPVDNGDSDDGIPPSAPAGVEMYYASDGSIAFDWQQNPEVDVTHYVVSRSVSDSSHFKVITPTSDLYFIDQGLSYDSLYSYYVNAVDRTGLISPPSVIVSAKPVNRYKPNTPRDFMVNCQNFDRPETRLIWDLSSEGDIYGYKIYRALTPDFHTDSSNLIVSTRSIGYTDTINLQVGTRYFYKIYAVDNGGLTSNLPAAGDDLPLPIPNLVFPADSQVINTVPVFKFVSLDVQCYYKLIIFTDPSLSDLQALEVGTTAVSDTISFSPQNFYFEYDKRYYWRILTYSNLYYSSNSASKINSFIIRR